SRLFRRWQRHARRAEGPTLAVADLLEIEAFDRGVEDMVPVEPGAQMQENATEADRRAVHEHELAGYAHRTLLFQGLVHPEGLLAPVLAGRGAIGDFALAVIQQWSVDEARPDVEHIDQFVTKAGKAPRLIGIDDKRALVVQQAVVEIDDTLHKRSR